MRKTALVVLAVALVELVGGSHNHSFLAKEGLCLHLLVRVVEAQNIAETTKHKAILVTLTNSVYGCEICLIARGFVNQTTTAINLDIVTQTLQQSHIYTTLNIVVIALIAIRELNLGEGVTHQLGEVLLAVEDAVRHCKVYEVR